MQANRPASEPGVGPKLEPHSGAWKSGESKKLSLRKASIRTQPAHIRYSFLCSKRCRCQASQDGKSELLTFFLPWAGMRPFISAGNTLCQGWEKQGERGQGRLCPFLTVSDRVLPGSPATKQQILVGYVETLPVSPEERHKQKERGHERERERSIQIDRRVGSATAWMLSFGPAFRGRKGNLGLHHELKPSRESKESTGGGASDIVPDQMPPLVTVKSKSKSLQGNVSIPNFSSPMFHLLWQWAHKHY